MWMNVFCPGCGLHAWEVLKNSARCLRCGYVITSHSPAWPNSGPQLAEPELRAEPITGWRVWRVVNNLAVRLTREQLLQYTPDKLDEWFGPRLAGVGYPSRWRAPVMEAQCDPLYESFPPHHNHPCGIWAVKSEQLMRQALAQYDHGDLMAYGTVELWGRYIEHRDGWRAQYARPKEITLHGLWAIGEPDESLPEIAEGLARRYRCQVGVAAHSPPPLRPTHAWTSLTARGTAQSLSAAAAPTPSSMARAPQLMMSGTFQQAAFARALQLRDAQERRLRREANTALLMLAVLATAIGSLIIALIYA